MRALVTGGAGFIGSALVRALAADGVPVAVIDALTYAGHRDNLSDIPGFDTGQLAEADVRDRERVRDVLEAFRPTVVFHLAAETHVDRSIDGPARCFDVNVGGTYALLEEATEYWRGLGPAERDAFRFLQVSTDEVFGSAGQEELFTESSRYAPNSPYAASKGAADYLVRTWSMAFDLPVLLAHGANTYGARQFPEKLVPLMILNGRDSAKLPVYGDGEQVRDWMHAEDHAAALRRVAEDGRVGESYILSARNPRTNIEVIRLLCEALDRRLPDGAPHARLIEHVADRPAHDRRYASDPSKIEKELGWRPRVAFGDGMDKTVAWYLDNVGWCARVSSLYGRQRLGLGAAAR
ncbi:MAG: dTDP-glucose 4,6-dehydratase [Alphaproteobacteria bacterium]|nr:dTDP-glucose 4,6-dehydratase [Alphaproteobacteria bacterium]